MVKNDILSLRIRKLVILLGLCEVMPAVLHLDMELMVSIMGDWIKIVLIFLFIFDFVRSERDITKVLFSTLCAVLVIVYNAHLIYVYAPEKMMLGRLGSYGMYRGANDYGLLLTCSLPLILKLSEVNERIIVKLVLFGLLGVAIFHIFLTGSRGSLIGSTVVITLCLWTRSSLSPATRRTIVFIALIAMMVIGGAKLASLRGDAGMSGGDDSSESRKDSWAACGRMLLSNPFGVGFEQSSEYMKEYGMYRSMPPHNTYVKVAAEAGWVGLFAYAGALYYAVSRLMKLEYCYRKIMPNKKVIIIQGLLFMLVGFMINTTFSQKEYEVLLYVALACSARVISLEGEVLKPQWTSAAS